MTITTAVVAVNIAVTRTADMKDVHMTRAEVRQNEGKDKGG